MALTRKAKRNTDQDHSLTSLLRRGTESNVKGRHGLGALAPLPWPVWFTWITISVFDPFVLVKCLLFAG